MGRFFLHYVAKPIGLYVILLIALGMLIGTTSWLAACVVLYPIMMIVWWGINLARWLNKKYKWEIVPFSIANLFVGFGITGVGYSLWLGLAVGVGIQNSIGFLVFIGSCVASIGWFLSSLYKLLAHRSEIYDSIHWLPFRLQGTIFTAASSLKTKERYSFGTSGYQGVMGQTKQKRKVKEESRSIFRTIGSNDNSQAEYGSIPIPPRREPQAKPKPKQNPTVQASPSVQISFSSPRGNFVTESKRYVNRSEANAIHVPFMQYWPTYGSMSPQQQKWYFYWRNQVRSGNFLPTDTSYMFVYIYELINLVGFNSPQAAFEQLVRFYRTYRESQPKLDNYLPDWIADFIVIHRLPIGVMAWYRKLGEMGVSGDEDLTIEAWMHSNGTWESVPMAALYRVADYNPTKAKFYKQEGGTMNLDAAYIKGLQAVDNHLQQTKQISLMETYQSSRGRLISRPIFASAVHDYPAKQIDITVGHSWIGNEPLGKALKNILRYTENVVRENNGYKHKLRDIVLDPEWEKAIKAAFIIAKPKQEIQIDSTALEQLKQESESIRKRLILSDEAEKQTDEQFAKLDVATNRLMLEQGVKESHEEETGVPEPVLKQVIEQAPKPETQKPAKEIQLDADRLEQMRAESEKLRERLIIENPEEKKITVPAARVETVQTGYTERPVDTAANLLTDLSEIASILGKAESDAAKLAQLMMANNWAASLNIIQAEFDGKFASVIIDTINEKAYEFFSDTLLFEEGGKWLLNEEYQDEVEYILKHPDYQIQVAENYADLSPEWADFAARLQSQHWDALAALLSKDDIENRLNAIAKAAHKMGNLLVDEINEAAQESLGDILVDTSEGMTILEEEQEQLTNLLNWAANRQMIEV